MALALRVSPIRLHGECTLHDGDPHTLSNPNCPRKSKLESPCVAHGQQKVNMSLSKPLEPINLL